MPKFSGLFSCQPLLECICHGHDSLPKTQCQPLFHNRWNYWRNRFFRRRDGPLTGSGSSTQSSGTLDQCLTNWRGTFLLRIRKVSLISRFLLRAEDSHLLFPNQERNHVVHGLLMWHLSRHTGSQTSFWFKFSRYSSLKQYLSDRLLEWFLSRFAKKANKRRSRQTTAHCVDS